MLVLISNTPTQSQLLPQHSSVFDAQGLAPVYIMLRCLSGGLNLSFSYIGVPCSVKTGSNQFSLRKFVSYARDLRYSRTTWSEFDIPSRKGPFRHRMTHGFFRWAEEEERSTRTATQISCRHARIHTYILFAMNSTHKGSCVPASSTRRNLPLRLSPSLMSFVCIGMKSLACRYWHP